MHNGVMQDSWCPGQFLSLVDKSNSSRRSRTRHRSDSDPVTIASEDPHLVLKNGVSRRVTAFPIPSGIKRRILERIWFYQFPVHTICRRPDFVVADARKEFFRTLLGFQPPINQIRSR